MITYKWCVYFDRTSGSDVSDATKNHKLVFKSPAVKVSIVKRTLDKSGEMSKAGQQIKQEGKPKASDSSTGLQSLMQNYDSDGSE